MEKENYWRKVKPYIQDVSLPQLQRNSWSHNNRVRLAVERRNFPPTIEPLINFSSNGAVSVTRVVDSLRG